MRRDRFLFGILIGIGALILIALALFFLRLGRTSYQDDSTPSGVANNYTLALQRRDYRRAYSYLAEDSQKPSFINFESPFLAFQAGELANTPVEIGEASIDEQTQTAVIPITLVRGGRGFLEEVYRETQTANLTWQNGAWKITSFPYPYWSYDWSMKIAPLVQPTVTEPAP